MEHGIFGTGVLSSSKILLCFGKIYISWTDPSRTLNIPCFVHLEVMESPTERSDWWIVLEKSMCVGNVGVMMIGGLVRVER